jgi:chromosome partitioning protein
MNVITLASRKGGAGKSTLTAHLAAYAHRAGHRCLVIDADPQGSLTLWHSLRMHGRLPLQSAVRGIDRAIAFAATDGYEWVLVDTAPTMWVVVQEAIRVATLVVIPARPGFFDLASIHETIAAARQRDKPFAVVLNAAPPKRDDRESPVVIQSRNYLDRLGIPVWSGQISHRAAYSLSLAGGTSACESEPGSTAAAEICALWSAIARSAEAVQAAHAAAREKHGRAA